MSNDNIEKLMNIDYTYPSPSDPEFQKKIYKKKEFYSHKIPKRPDLDNYEDIKEHRDNVCASQRIVREHQAFLSNFINPDTPYKGLLIFHGTGIGKTCAAIQIIEKFKDMFQRYNTKAYILVQGPLLRESWREELLKCTGETYLKYQDNTNIMNENERNRERKNALNVAHQYYQFMSYNTFYKKVLGEKVYERRLTSDGKPDKIVRKTKEGEFERDISIDRITSLDNTIIVVDEAHNLTDNFYGEALTKIIRSSTNLTVVLLTATPMKNKADDIIELLNFIRPPHDPILRERIFTSDKNYKMNFKSDGIDYLKKMSSGYVSYLRGADPITFAKRNEKGVVSKGLLFTKLIRCEMEPFQKNAYETVIKIYEDALDRNSGNVANFAFPGLSDDRKSLQSYSGTEGLNIVVNQLKTHLESINKKVALEILENKDLQDDTDLIHISESGKTISGSILKFEYLKYFSTKFYRALKKLNRLVIGKKGPKIAFVYSNLVRVGVELFQEILNQNGYLEFQENSSDYVIRPDTICYYCGKKYKDHNKSQIEVSTSTLSRSITSSDDSSSNYRVTTSDDENTHKFNPATYVSITGQSSDEAMDLLPEDKQRILDNVFNTIGNKDGKYIKIVLGSKVMNEGITLKHVGEVHILDVHYNLGRVDQVTGRAIRYCSHYNIMNEKNKYPEVNVYKYAVIVDKGLSREEELYRKAEKKYLLIKKVERVLKENAIDCPLNKNGNIFSEEVEEYKNCGEKGQKPCPAICDYMKCEFKCEDKILNNKYYDSKRKIYRKLTKEDLDISTFTESLARSEINYVKNKIKDMYRTKFAYNLNNILNYIKSSYKGEKKDLFDDFFVFKALDELIPVTENDFNNFNDTVLDKYNRPGYVIYVDRYYIFQPFDQNENVPMYYRSTYNKPLINKLSLFNYLKNKPEYKSFIGKKGKYLKDVDTEEDTKEEISFYNFDDVFEYYNNKDEYEYVGIIDKEASRRKSKHVEDLKDVFKIREKRSKILDKKRGTGIPSLKGAVCATSKSREYLEQIANDIGLKLLGKETRTVVCNKIMKKFLELEKYNKKGITYIMIPKNHPKYPFPYNLGDRADYIKDDLENKANINVKINKDKFSSGQYKGYNYYILIIKNDKNSKSIKDDIIKYGGKLKKDKWSIVLE